MKTMSLFTAGLMMISMNAVAKSLVVEGESLIGLEGTIATMHRPSTDGDDAEVIKKCGKTYAALILSKPIQVEVQDVETGEKSVVETYRLAIHAGAQVSKGLDRVSGVVLQDIAGSCNAEDFGIYGK